jgi:beta-galactosidase
LGTKKATADSAPLVYDFDFQPGTLKVVGRNGGKVVATHEMKTADEPTKLTIEADRKTIKHEFNDVSHVIVKLVDDKGIVNPNAIDLLTFKIDGPGKIIATSTGDRTSHQSFTALERKAYHGECMAIVRSTADSGKINITVSAEGYPDAKIELEAAPGGEVK